MLICVMVAATLGACGDRGDRFGDTGSHERATFCEDGSVQGDGALPDVDAGGEDAGPEVSPGPKRVFVTSRTWEAEMTAYARQETGLASADVVCQQVAEEAGLEGRFVAWMSDDQFDAIDRIDGEGPFVRMDGEVLFPDHASLAGVPLAPITVNELGETYACDSGTHKVWTGTRTGGRWGLYDCVGWTSRDGDFDAMMGDVCGIEDWTERSGGLRSCNSDYRIYCFEQ
jgi:hypothetical protein